MQKDWTSILEGNNTRKVFSRLYGKNEETIEKQILRYKELINTFKSLYPEDKKEIQLFSTSGRTEAPQAGRRWEATIRITMQVMY